MIFIRALDDPKLSDALIDQKSPYPSPWNVTRVFIQLEPSQLSITMTQTRIAPYRTWCTSWSNGGKGTCKILGRTILNEIMFDGLP